MEQRNSVLVMSKRAIPAALMLVMAVTAISCVRQRIQARKCRIAIEEIGLRELTLTGVTLVVKLAVTNPGSIEAIVDRMELYLEIEGRRVAGIDVDALTVPAGETAIAETIVALPFSSIGIRREEFADGRNSIRYRLAGSAFIRTSLGEMRVPVTVSEK